MAKKAAIKTKHVFNLFEDGVAMKDAVREVMNKACARLKRDPGVMYHTLDQHKRLLVPIPLFPLAWLLNTKGLMSGTIVDILGGDHLGKTTLIFTIMGCGMLHGCPALYIETENKLMLEDRIKQCLSSDKALAQKMFDVMMMDKATEIREAVTKIHSWLAEIRNPDSGHYVPMSIPAIVALDTFSKLLTPAELNALAQYGMQVSVKEADEKKKEKIKELGGGSNLEHAKMAHAWMRQLPHVLRYYNAIIILGRHQNDKIDMGAPGGGSLVPESARETFNRSSIGGRAINQSAAYQIILTKMKSVTGEVRGERVTLGQWIKASVSKNSFGPPRKMDYLINILPRRETAHFIDPALDFDMSLPYILLQTGLLQMKCINLNCYDCKELNLEHADCHDFGQAFYANQPLVDSICDRLRFVGHQPEFSFPKLVVAPPAPPTEEEEIVEDDRAHRVAPPPPRSSAPMPMPPPPPPPPATAFPKPPPPPPVSTVPPPPPEELVAEPAAETTNNAETMNNDTAPVKRKRGRPRKVDVAASVTPVAPAAPKRRGRPPKNAPAASVPAAAPQARRKPGRPAKVAAVAAVPAAPKRKRGRPRKIQSVTTAKPVAAPVAPKRKRGRPSKASIAAAAAASATSGAATPANGEVKRKRGRPRKNPPV